MNNRLCNNRYPLEENDLGILILNKQPLKYNKKELIFLWADVKGFLRRVGIYPKQWTYSVQPDKRGFNVYGFIVWLNGALR